MQPLDLQMRTVPNLKDLIHICLETKFQGCGMLAQITPISYHTEAVVKKEVGCTVQITPLVISSSVQV